MKSKRKERERMGDASRVAHFAGIQKINKNAEQNEFHCWPLYFTSSIKIEEKLGCGTSSLPNTQFK